MTPAYQNAADLRILAQQLQRSRDSIHEIADRLKRPIKEPANGPLTGLTNEYMMATTAELHIFSAIKEMLRLAEGLEPQILSQPQNGEKP